MTEPRWWSWNYSHQFFFQSLSYSRRKKEKKRRKDIRRKDKEKKEENRTQRPRTFLRPLVLNFDRTQGREFLGPSLIGPKAENFASAVGPSLRQLNFLRLYNWKWFRRTQRFLPNSLYNRRKFELLVARDKSARIVGDTWTSRGADLQTSKIISLSNTKQQEDFHDTWQVSFSQPRHHTFHNSPADRPRDVWVQSKQLSRWIGLLFLFSLPVMGVEALW